MIQKIYPFDTSRNPNNVVLYSNIIHKPYRTECVTSDLKLAESDNKTMSVYSIL